MAVITEGDKIAAAMLACEASRQHQEEIKAGPGRPPSSRDITGELWSFFEHFIGRLSDRQRVVAPARQSWKDHATNDRG